MSILPLLIRADMVEPSVKDSEAGAKYQFERLGYYCVDRDSADKLVFNRTIGLRDTWAKIEKRATSAA